MKKIIISVIIIVTVLQAKGQSGSNEMLYPEIGKRCPNFILTDVNFYIKKRVILNDFKGKWLIIDCWNRFCSNCIASFPQTDSLQKRFSKNVQFVCIGYTGQYGMNSSDKQVRLLYERARKENNLHLIMAYDSVFFHRFDIAGCPFIIIVDPNGILRGITFQLSAQDISAFIAGKQPKLKPVVTMGEEMEERLIQETFKKTEH